MKEYKLKINSNDYHVVVSGLSNGRADVMVNGQSYSVEIADAGAASDAGKSASAPAVTATAPAPAAKPAAGGAVKSPLPGVVLDIQVAVGDRVGTGQRLMILEAMKMENNSLHFRQHYHPFLRGISSGNLKLYYLSDCSPL